MAITVDKAREIALKIIYDINENNAYSNIAINKHLEANDLRGVDKAFITELVYGTVKWKLAIDWTLGQYSNIKLKKLSPWILNILRLGAYQLIYTDRIPASAACNESVKLAKKYGHSASSGFANAVLRSIARSGNQVKLPDKEADPVSYMSVKYSHPDWMVREWLRRYGAGFTESLLDSNNQIPDFIVRVNTLKTEKDSLMEALRSAGLEVEEGRYAREAIIIRNPASMTKLNEFKNGLFQVQGESSMLVAHVLDPQPGELIMDVCSAPGGKATHIAELMKNKGVVIARDIHQHKISIIEENIRRLGINIVQAEIFNAVEVDDTYAEKADRVLVDAPCTGFGIIRSKPDIKWARNMGDTKEIVGLQTGILHAASRYVRPGGTLVYSTCTIEPEENQDVVQAFLKSNAGFRMVDISPLLPAELRQESAAEGYIQMYPNMHGIDGFFIARMERTR